MNDECMIRIIRNWCNLFKIAQLKNKSVGVAMEVGGFTYSFATYPTMDAAIETSYKRAHAHTWTTCFHVEMDKIWLNNRYN